MDIAVLHFSGNFSRRKISCGSSFAFLVSWVGNGKEIGNFSFLIVGIIEKWHMEDWLALTVQIFFLTADFEAVQTPMNCSPCWTARLCRCRVLEHSASLEEASQQAFLRLMLLKI